VHRISPSSSEIAFENGSYRAYGVRVRPRRQSGCRLSGAVRLEPEPVVAQVADPAPLGSLAIDPQALAASGPTIPSGVARTFAPDRPTILNVDPGYSRLSAAPACADDGPPNQQKQIQTAARCPTQGGLSSGSESGRSSRSIRRFSTDGRVRFGVLAADRAIQYHHVGDIAGIWPHSTAPTNRLAFALGCVG
jgi:hypothetical protein